MVELELLGVIWAMNKHTLFMLGLQHYYWDIMIDYRPLVFERRVVKAVGHFGVVRLAKSPLGTPLKEREAAGQESRSHWASV